MAKNVLITGITGGIGASISKRLYRDGFNIAGVSHNKEFLVCDLSLLNENGGRCVAVKADVSDEEEVEEAFRQAEEELGFIDTVVNCAGVSSVKLLTDTSSEEFDRLCSVNFKGVFNVCKACVPAMVREKRGNIINIASMWGVSGASCESVYSATKAAVIGLTKSLARELGPSGIRVNCIAPGAIDTAMNNNLSPEEKAAFASEIPLGRFGTPDEIAGVVSFLASDDSSYITGNVITPDGGYT